MHIATTVLATLLTIFTLNGAAKSVKSLDPESPTVVTTFAAIRDIHTIAMRLAKKYRIMPGDTCGKLSTYCDRTQQGLFLFMGLTTYALATPWGLVSIYGNYTHESEDDVFNLTADFFKYIAVEFVKPHREGVGATFYRVDSNNICHRITESSLDRYRGTHERIFDNSWVYHTIYKIKALGGIALPEPIQASTQDLLAYTGDVESWNLLMKRYESATTKL